MACSIQQELSLIFLVQTSLSVNIKVIRYSPRSCGVMISTLDSESDDPSSNLSGTRVFAVLTPMPLLGGGGGRIS